MGVGGIPFRGKALHDAHSFSNVKPLLCARHRSRPGHTAGNKTGKATCILTYLRQVNNFV